MFSELERINNARPLPFEFYTAGDLWTEEHVSDQMLAFHLNTDIDVASRKASFIDRSVARIINKFGVRAGTRIADFGCWPGLYAIRLARAQAAVTGIDFSPRSIGYGRAWAERERLAVNFVQQNYLEFETANRFALIMMIMCDFCALGPIQRRTMLRKFHAMLQPDSALLFDVYSLTTFASRAESATYTVNLLDGF